MIARLIDTHPASGLVLWNAIFGMLQTGFAIPDRAPLGYNRT
jgi:hypothetical protein